MSSASQVISEQLSPFPWSPDISPWLEREQWPARWITVNEEPAGSFASAFRVCFTCDETLTIPLLVTADQRYQLFLNGKRIGRGPERGVLRKWLYERYEVTLERGEHCLQALCWFIAENMPPAQVTAGAGFLLAVPDTPFTEKISTGLAPWQGQVLENVTFLDNTWQVGREIGGGARVSVVGRPPQEIAVEPGGNWANVSVLEPGNNAFLMNTLQHSRVLYPGTLPPMRQAAWSGARVAAMRNTGQSNRPFDEIETRAEECRTWQQMLDSENAVTVAAGQSRQVLIDLGNYVCAYYGLKIAGGAEATVTVGWAERLSAAPDSMKAPEERNKVEGRFFVGTWDHFEPDSPQWATYEPLWWQSGRWVLISLRAGREPLTIKSFDIQETGYPLEDSSSFTCDDSVLNAVAPVAFRTLRACAHETYMDCPYWEQLQYIGDTRLQALITYATARDSRLAVKAIDLFRYSITGASPFLSSSYPGRYVAAIAPFSLWWICMLHDHALWRGNKPFIREMLPVAWWIIDHFLISRTTDGLVQSPQGWNYIDACFPGQEAPGGQPGGVSGLLNWQLVLALTAAGELSDWTGETELADRAARLAREISESIIATFWDEGRRCLADDPEHDHYSEHSQCLALLSGLLPEELRQEATRALLHDPDLLRVLPYFTHYLCDALADSNEGHVLVDRLRQWNVFLEAGFSTFPEHRIIGRSDCHAWNAHPLYHMLRSILGIRPASFGFDRILIKPCPGFLRDVSGTIPHPNGRVSAQLLFSESGLSARIHLPENTSGQLQWSGITQDLRPGTQTVEIRQ